VLRASQLARELQCDYREIRLPLDRGQLMAVDPDVVIDCTGRYVDYSLPRLCMELGINYIDIADNRAFVCGIGALDASAKAHSVIAVAGASTVPGLSSAILAEIERQGLAIDSVEYGISPGNRTPRGLGTVASVLGFVGRAIEAEPRIWGWGGLVRRHFPGVGMRWLSYCDCADWRLLPARFGLRRLEFRAGLELGFLHIALWCAGLLVRSRLVDDLSRYSRFFKWVADRFESRGTDRGGMYLSANCRDVTGTRQQCQWSLVARDGDGPYVPTLAATALVVKLSRGECIAPGAYACVDVVSLREIEDAAVGLNIEFHDIAYECAASS
jgi:hypothetical protein